MAEEVVGQQTQGQAAQAQTTPGQSSASQPAPAPATSIPSGGAGQAAAPQGAAAASPAPMSVVQALSQQYGLDLGVQDDHAALARLAQAYQVAQQSHQLAQYGQMYLQHADQFNAYMRQQQAEQQRAQQQQRQSWWKAPDYDPSWTQKILRDPTTGELRVIPGADPTIVPKYLAWVDHQRGVMDRLAQDPLAVIQPGLEQLIDQRAQALIQQHMGVAQEQYAARDFVRQNSSWLHQRDQQGQVLYDQRTGREALSPAGQRFAQHVVQAEQLGLNTNAQAQYAMGMTQRDVMYALLASQAGQQPAAATDPAQASKAQFLQQAAANAQHTQAAAVQNGQQGNVNGNTPPIGGSQRRLREQMMADLAQAGILPHHQIL